MPGWLSVKILIRIVLIEVPEMGKLTSTAVKEGKSQIHTCIEKKNHIFVEE